MDSKNVSAIHLHCILFDIIFSRWSSILQSLPEKRFRQKIENSPAEERSSLREKLYRLNNILVECQTASFLSLEGIISLWRIRNSLKEIKEELKSKDFNGNFSQQKNGQG
ncbi:hypothetical protein OIU85_022964 [Salix viminalis]|uniref:Uncharacterized protein n=1 Tax=Salix viminalis TaxID=40686 RepID=A0A9Q0U7X8_SALVM|nr:hypothetical protein OIU85_022964 [Salix viminalis]